MSRDPLLYVADIVTAGEAILRYTDGVTFDDVASNDEKRSAVERQVFIIGEAAARLPEEWKLLRTEMPWRKIVGLRNLTFEPKKLALRCPLGDQLGRRSR